MSDLEQELDPNEFCRIHRSTIVNLDRVRSLESGEDDESILVLEDGTRLRMSRRYRKPLQERLGVRGK
jgi:two-component system LytT family response regulator